MERHPIQNVLFNSSAIIEGIVREPVRPLGGLSDYVIEQFPQDVDAVRKGGSVDDFIAASNQRLEGITARQIASLPNRLQRIAALDIRMIQAAAIHLQPAPGEEKPDTRSAGEVIDRLGKDLAVYEGTPDTLLYDHVIMCNPDQDIRTFTPQNTGIQEASFYVVHQMHEVELGRMNEELEHAIQALLKNKEEKTRGDQQAAQRYADEVHHHLKEAKAHFVNNKKSMGQMMPRQVAESKNLNREDFHSFRLFFGANRGYQGASGYFSHGIAKMDILLRGTHMTHAHWERYKQRLQYYPGAYEISTVLDRAEKGTSVSDLIMVGSEFVRDLEDIQLEVNSWRRMHGKAVQGHLATVYEGKENGTLGDGSLAVFTGAKRSNPDPKEIYRRRENEC